MKAGTRIVSMAPYSPIEPVDVLSTRLGIPIKNIIKLDANENPYGPSPLAIAALKELDYIHIYPDPECRVLRDSLSLAYNVPVNNLLAGSGADELIDLLLRVLVEPGDYVLNCPPTFGMYGFDTVLNYGTVIDVPRKPDFSLDLENIRSSIEKYHPKILFVCSPNNPDGSLLSEAEIQFLLTLPTLIVLDEAYIEFTQKDFDLGRHQSLITRVSERDNLVVLRTFSKWAGLAGLRIGFGAFPDWIISSLWKAKQPYNVNLAGSAAAIASLQDRENLALNVAKIQSERAFLFEKLQQFSQFEPHPTQSNFILCKTKGIQAKEIKSRLAEHGVFIRHYDTILLKDSIRISVGRPEDTTTLINQLEKIV